MREILAEKGGSVGEEIVRKFCLNSHFHENLGIFCMPQIYDMGPTAFTSPPKEGVLRIFSP